MGEPAPEGGSGARPGWEWRLAAAELGPTVSVWAVVETAEVP
ncbi:MAG TPA: hypothetical protein VJ622_08675 [Acidimicrobiia bacterium]|nr:hypothetical protein [Acidimicrobiia bacterium]HTC80336.1 hypothetical protein [Acidimicrobiia bacterium]